jgi:hypothetical protein
MIVEDEKELVRVSLDLNENESATIVLPLEVHTSDILNPCFADVTLPLSSARPVGTTCGGEGQCSPRALFLSVFLFLLFLFLSLPHVP